MDLAREDVRGIRCRRLAVFGQDQVVDPAAGQVERAAHAPVVDREWAWEQIADTVDDYFHIENERPIQVVGDVLTEDHRLGISSHRVVERAVDRGDEIDLLAGGHRLGRHRGHGRQPGAHGLHLQRQQGLVPQYRRGGDFA